jgi:hypothetical protein
MSFPHVVPALTKNQTMQKMLITFLMLLSLFAVTPVFSAAPAFYLTPDSSLAFRDSLLTLYIATDEASANLKAYSLEISFNRSVIRAGDIDVVEGPLLATGGQPTFFWVEFSPDSAKMYIDAAILGDGVTVNGAGILAAITFHTIGFGETDVAFTSIRVRDGANNQLTYAAVDSWIKVCRFVGDVNADNRINISDCVYLINWIFGNGPLPVPDPLIGDVNCTGLTNISDVVYIINYIFSSGPAPCGPCY